MPNELPASPDLSGLSSEELHAISALVNSAVTYRGAFFATIEGTDPMKVVQENEPMLHLSDRVINAWATHLEIDLGDE